MKRIRTGEQVDLARLNPMPFPGLYPTRWKIKFDYYKGRKLNRYTENWKPDGRWEYEGKPNSVIAQRMYVLMAGCSGRLAAVEYDCGGPIAMANMITPRGELNVLGANSLFHFYDPWNAQVNGRMISPWRAGRGSVMNRARMHWQGKTWVVYTPFNREYPCPGSYLEVYKQWLEKQNLKF